MPYTFKEWVEIFSGAIAAAGIFVASLNYRSQTKTKRAEWLKALFEKYYEYKEYKEVRKWIDYDLLKDKLHDNSTSLENEEKLADYLNFFEFIATLKADGHLTLKDVLNLFEYYLRQVKIDAICRQWIKDYGFENLRTLLCEIK